ncbi:MAG: hypothetical protein PF436_00980 [Prolixibacteraceae bacterium]|jgi:hypothetical protein|nr:hypothetical protein [Prolixibacteraceae bacterium]
MKKEIILTIGALLLIITAFASDVILQIFRTDKTVQEFTVSNVEDITFTNNDSMLIVSTINGIEFSIPVAEIDSMQYINETRNKAALQLLAVDNDAESGETTCTVEITDDGGCPVLERGICWSTSTAPTINDNKYSAGYTSGKYYGIIPQLPHKEKYYVRAYAINCEGISYSGSTEIKTMMGHVTYTLDLDSAAYPQYYNLLVEALDSACYYYSKYTEFRANIYCYYNAGIPTAQANYHGSIGYGPNTTYMWVGTTMHEMAHYFGSGTTNVWKNNLKNGVWQGEAGQELSQKLFGATLKGDNNSNPIHFWPGGINYRSEVSSVNDLINHAKIVQAMLVDDCKLPTSW